MNFPMRHTQILIRSCCLATCVALCAASAPLQEVPPAQDPAQRQVAEKRVKKPVAIESTLEESILTSDIALLNRLDKPFAEPASFRDVTAGDIVAAVRKETEIPIEIDRRAIGDAGGWEFIRVTCNPKTPRAALDAVVRAISPDYDSYALDIASGIVVITDASGQAKLRATMRYPYASLLSRLSTQPTREPAALDAETPSPNSPVAALTRYLELITPDAWQSNGGSLASVSFIGTIASINVTPMMHQAIRSAIEDLTRELPSANLQWSFRVASLESKASEADILAAVASADGLDALVARGGATIVSAPRIIAQRTKDAEISIGSDAAKLEIKVIPMHTPTQEVFAVRMSETTTSPNGALQCGVTLSTIPGVRCAAALDGKGRRLLIEVIGFSESAQRLLDDTAAKEAAAQGAVHNAAKK